MSYMEITARLKLKSVGKRNPENDLRLCNDFREEIVALLDRLHKSSRIGELTDFDIYQCPFVKVDIVD